MTPIFIKNKLISSPKMDAKFVQKGDGGAHENPAGAILEALGPNMLPRWPRVAQDSPKLAQSRSQGAPKMVRHDFK